MNVPGKKAVCCTDDSVDTWDCVYLRGQKCFKYNFCLFNIFDHNKQKRGLLNWQMHKGKCGSRDMIPSALYYEYGIIQKRS